ncbi:transmembrane protein 245 isoform X1 [Neodiprion pinetum]|uniref:Transmembrane protein 245 isoform X1 n=1 Tax=Neodiprion lecontei TaxID=441921 RepID=A0A6J0BKX8_NEOLC|nr:transmembrane protein 245 isoform X1 [Neodiprion lecontei]XP_046483830.1 transmembrane protein 245 isoform X1 [Neodiprion pinetum]XP_046483831.1 transmembrane protein 245 isoform X1 [Neodiprion pinetum]XP_046596958.1 transmembrane protein 245 isoform X1 [Neodiprion lecontei]
MEAPRTPMDNLLNMLGGFSPGHEKALKQGFYNAVALFLLFAASAAFYGLYFILSPFVKPLIWALLCGSVLFPFKLRLTTAVQSWFVAMESSNKPLIVNVAVIPLRFFDDVSEIIGSLLRKYFTYIGPVLVGIPTLLLIYNYTPSFLTCIIWREFQIANTIINFFVSTCGLLTVTTIVIGYLSVLYVYWSPGNSIQFRYMSFVIWFVVSLYISNLIGAYQVIVFVILQLLFLLGFIYEVVLVLERQGMEGRRVTFVDAARTVFSNHLVSQIPNDSSSKSLTPEDDVCMLPRSSGEGTSKFFSELEEQKFETSKESKTLPPQSKLCTKSMSLDADVGMSPEHLLNPQTSKSMENMRARSIAQERNFLKKLKIDFKLSLDIEDDTVNTEYYMYFALYACIGMLVWKHKWMIQLLSLPIAYYLIKQIGSSCGFWKFIDKQYSAIVDTVATWCNERHQALVPAHVRGLYKIGVILNKKLTEVLKGSVDAVATTAVILGLLIFTTCASIFITIQVYAEGMHLIQVTGDVLNSSLVNNADIDWVPEQWEDSVNSVLDNAYTYGRSAISDGIKGLVKDMEPIKAEMMEKKVLELWDRLYQAWMMSNADPAMVGPTVDADAAYSVWESFKDSFGKAPLQLFNMTSVQNFAKENVGILMSLLDSVWGIVKGNVSVITSVFTELLYVVLMSGSAVLNFMLSMVVFFTTLFYLLSSSGKTYKPIELITVFSPISCNSILSIGRFAIALEEAVIGVFAATFKLASFFGMWTWFTHNLFQVKIVYLPSAFATMLGAVPFLDAYIACVPAAMELWFTRGSMVALAFFVFHFAPFNIVVTDFYKEIKGGGHPYLTGLSIAGGVFCLGVQGAIFGPLLLCCIMVAINLSRRYLHSPSEEAIYKLKSQFSRLKGGDI